MNPVFAKGEREALLLLLRRMGHELRPRRLQPKDYAQWDERVNEAAERTLSWVSRLNPNDSRPTIEGTEPGKSA
jgi:hypothetical protein